MHAKSFLNKRLPVSKYIVRHGAGDEKRIRPCVHFITFGEYYGGAEVVDFHIVLRLNLVQHLAPPQHLCKDSTGQDRQLVHSFFAIPANEAAYRDALATLRLEMEREMEKKLKGRCIAFLINCTLGRHRSVAMAERLAETVGRWGGYRSECLHLDLMKARNEEARTPIRVVFTRPSDVQARGTKHRHRQGYK